MSSGGKTPELVLYSSPGCHLCEEARTMLSALAPELGFSVVERDITTDDRLHRSYLERIPVGVLDGRELFQYFVDEAALRAALEAAERGR